MASGIKQAGADLAFKGGLLNGNRYVALFSAEGAELSGNGYARNVMALADWQVDGAGYENVAQEIFGPPTGAVWLPVSHWGLYSALTSGNLLFDIDIADTGAPAIGASVAADAEQIGWSFTGIPTDGSLACMSEGLLSGTRYLSLHAGAVPAARTTQPAVAGNAINTDGSSGYAAGKDMIALSTAAADWGLDSVGATTRRARNNKILSFGIQTADLPDPMSLALRDGDDHDSKILWTSTLTADDPALGDALQFAVNAIAVPLTITAAA